MKKIIKGGKVVSETGIFQSDILIIGEKIVALGYDFAEDDDTVVYDAQDMFILPGGVDAHVHLDLPMFGTISSDDHYSGTKAAACGGTTTVIDFANHDQPSLIDSLNAWKEKALPNIAVDYALHMNFTRFNADTLAEIKLLPDLGVPSVKMFTAYNGRMRLQDGEIFQVLREAQKHGVISLIHAENGDLIDLQVAEALAAGHKKAIYHAKTRSAYGAAESVLRVCMLAAEAGNAPLYIVHMNTAYEADQLLYAKQNGIPVFGETCPQYLLFSDKELERKDGAKWICSPPLRKVNDNNALWEAISDGIIDVIATDHCPFLYNGTKAILYENKSYQMPGKELGKTDFSKTPNGLPGVGDRLPVMWTAGVLAGHITPSKFVQTMCANPAKIFGLYPKKGCINPGSDADIVIWDFDEEIRYGVKYAQHRTDYNLYEGMELLGFPQKVFLRGELIVEHGKWHGKRGNGQFLKRDPFTSPPE